MDKVKVLFLAANPATTSQGVLEEEIRAIDTKIRGAAYRDRLDLLSHWAVRLDDLSGLLMRHRPNIVHLSGRGSSDGALVVPGDEEGSRDLSPTTRGAGTAPAGPDPVEGLARLLGVLRDNVRVVVLNACGSSAEAEAMLGSIDCVVNVGDGIPDDLAVAFAAEFYQALGFGRSLKEAFDVGLTRLLNEGHAGATSQVTLHSPRGVDPATLRVVGPSQSGGRDVPLTSPSLWKPPFHCGLPVPLDFFINRERELEEARALIESRQSFLLVGKPRAGKSSFGKKLVEAMRAEGATRGGRAFGCSIDLRQYSTLDESSFLAYTLLNIIGEVARTVFPGKSTTLSKKDPFDELPSLRHDDAFKDLLELNRQVVARTHTRGDNRPPDLRTDEFERFISDLVLIIRRKGWSGLFIFYDEANHLPLVLSERFLSWNVEALGRAEAVSIYAASPEMAERFNDWSTQDIPIGPFLRREDMLRLLSRYYFGEASLRDDLPISRDAIVQIWDASEGVPYLIQRLSNQSFVRACAEGARRVEQKHVQAARADLARLRPGLFPDRPER